MEEEQQELCNRCQNKPVEIQCMNCTLFKNLCSRCDSVIHSSNETRTFKNLNNSKFE